MPLAKSAINEPTPTLTQPVIAPPMSPGVANFEWQGIPLDIGRFLNTSVIDADTKTLEKMRDIAKWSENGLIDNTLGNRLQKIRTLESKLGAPALHETRIDKLWKWIKMDFHISELRKRQEAYER
jgi:hypothetical protein